MHKLKFQLESKAKLGKIAHFSTIPYDTCYQKCSYCYAMKSVRMYPNVKKCYTDNTKALDNGARLPDIPQSRNIIRMYISGDFQNIHTIKEWIRLAKRYPMSTFYGYTKQWKNKKFLYSLNHLRTLPNVVLRASVDEKTGYNIPDGWVKAGIFKVGDHEASHIKKAKRYHVCASSKKNGLKCDTCKICFMPKLKHLEIYFPAH